MAAEQQYGPYPSQEQVGDMSVHMRSFGRLPVMEGGPDCHQTQPSTGTVTLKHPGRPLPAIPASAAIHHQRQLERPIPADLERNPSASTAQTRASDTNPPTEESARLETPPSGVLLAEGQYQWAGDEDADGHLRSSMLYSEGGSYGVEGEQLGQATTQVGGSLSTGSHGSHGLADMHEQSQTATPLAQRSLASPITPGPLSRINWEGDLHHRAPFATLGTTILSHTHSHNHDRDQSFNHSHDSSSTITPTKIPLSTEDNHGDVSRIMRPRAGSTGAQSTAMSLYSIGGFLMAEPRRPSGAGSMLGVDGLRRERRNSESSIASGRVLSSSLGRRTESGLEDCVAVQASPSSRPKPGEDFRPQMKTRRSARNTFGPTEAGFDIDVDVPTSDKDTDAEKSSGRRRRSSVRHPYDPPARRAPPPPTFYIEKTPPTSPILQEEQALPSTPTTPRRMDRMRRFMSASGVSLPIAPSSTTCSHDMESNSAQRSIRDARTRRLSTPTSGRRIRAMMSSSVISLPSTSMHVGPDPLPPLPVSASRTGNAHKHPSVLLGPPVEGRLQAKRSTSAISIHQEASNEIHAQSMVKHKLGKKASKRVSIEPKILQATMPGDKVSESHNAQTQDGASQDNARTPRKGAFGELWRRMSAGRKGRKSKMAEEPVVGHGDDRIAPNEWGGVEHAPSLPAAETSAAASAAPPASSKTREVRRKSVPAYHNHSLGDLTSLSRTACLPASRSEAYGRTAAQYIEHQEQTAQYIDGHPYAQTSPPPVHPHLHLHPGCTRNSPAPSSSLTSDNRQRGRHSHQLISAWQQ